MNFFCFGAIHLAMPKGYFWWCDPEYTLGGWYWGWCGRVPYGIPGVELRSAPCKISTLLAILSLQPP